MKKLLPAPGKVLLIQHAAAAESKGGILIPDASRDIENYGEIVEVGEGVKGIAKGDKVFFLPYEGDYVEVESKQYLVLDAANILAVVEKEE